MKIIASFIFGLFTAAATPAYGQDWRDVKPVETTHKDVVRLFGEKTKDGGPCGAFACSYELPQGGTIRFSFPLATCDGVPPGSLYNFPPGAVSHVRVWPGPAYNLSISDLNIDVSNFTRSESDHGFLDVYESRELGMRIKAGKTGQVNSLEYFPAARYKKILACPSASEAEPKPPAARE
jgi:hypothetical protein